MQTRYAATFLCLLSFAFQQSNANDDAVKNSFAYSANIHHGSISIFAIDEQGKLDLRNNIAAGKAPRGMMASETNLYMVDIWDHTISNYEINPTTGELSLRGKPQRTGLSPEAVALHPNLPLLFVANGDTNDISVFRIDDSESGLTDQGRYSAGEYPTGMAIDACGKFLYATNYSEDTVTGFRIDKQKAALIKIADTPTGHNPAAAVVDPSGRFLYVADGLGNTLSSYRINQDNGELQAIDRIPAPEYPYAMAAHPNGRFFYTANYGSHDVTLFEIDDTTGKAIKIESFATGKGSFSIMFNDTAEYLYVANVTAGSHSVMKVNAETGKLTQHQTKFDKAGATIVVNSTPVFQCKE